MLSQTSIDTGWRRAAIGALACGALVTGVLAAAPGALAEPSDPSTPVTPGAAAAPSPAGEQGSPVTPGGAAAGGLANDAAAGDRALAEIAATYDTGDGGGQISKLIHSVMLLRSQGFYPSKGNVIALQEGLDKRPNQGPIVAALEQTLAFQRRAQQRAAMAPQNPVNAGIGGNNGGMWMGPALGPTGGGPAVNIPLG